MEHNPLWDSLMYNSVVCFVDAVVVVFWPPLLMERPNSSICAAHAKEFLSCEGSARRIQNSVCIFYCDHWSIAHMHLELNRRSVLHQMYGCLHKKNVWMYGCLHNKSHVINVKPNVWGSISYVASSMHEDPFRTLMFRPFSKVIFNNLMMAYELYFKGSLSLQSPQRLWPLLLCLKTVLYSWWFCAANDVYI